MYLGSSALKCSLNEVISCTEIPASWHPVETLVIFDTLSEGRWYRTVKRPMRCVVKSKIPALRDLPHVAFQLCNGGLLQSGLAVTWCMTYDPFSSLASCLSLVTGLFVNNALVYIEKHSLHRPFTRLHSKDSFLYLWCASSSPRASEISGLATPNTPSQGPWNRAPSSVGSRFSVRRFMTGSRMGSFKRASGMDDDDVDSNLFFDRVYCANPQVRIFSLVGRRQER